MSRQSHEYRKLRAPNSLTAIAGRSHSGARKPLAFDRQLAAARLATASSPSWLGGLYACFIQSIQRLGQRLLKRRGRRRKLDLVDIQQLGEKRFVAVVRVGKQKFLISGAAGSVALLAEITPQRATAIAPPQVAPPLQDGA
jgi:hypothetical protein